MRGAEDLQSICHHLSAFVSLGKQINFPGLVPFFLDFHLCKFSSSVGCLFVDIADLSFESGLCIRFYRILRWHCLDKGFLFCKSVPAYHGVVSSLMESLTCVYSPSNRLMLLKIVHIWLFWSQSGTTMKETCSSTMSPSWNMCGPVFLKLLSLSYTMV